MNICVFGLWHLGCVTAACVAEQFQTVGLDPAPATIDGLKSGRAPIFEPGLNELIEAGLSRGALRFTDSVAEAVSVADVVWVTFDTPVDEEDRADVESVRARIVSLFPYLRNGAVVLISSQVPVGTVRQIEAAYREAFPDGRACFAYSPENLRLGKALEVFRNPGRVVIGARDCDRRAIEKLFKPFCDNLIWMSVESAEMTKHALNAFLANSIAFSNEIAAVCEEVGADAKEVERGLKSDQRIGPGAYLSPGGPFAGGTLARDIAFLTAAAESLRVSVPLLEAVRRSNDLHKHWPRRKLAAVLGDLSGKRIAVLGLTYKPGTDTLRRSASIELCRWLLEHGARVTAFDPRVKTAPADLAGGIELAASAEAALDGCDAAVVGTAWPEFRALAASEFISRMKTPLILDPGRFLGPSISGAPSLMYLAVGMPREIA